MSWEIWKSLDEKLQYNDAAVYELRIIIEKATLAIPRFLANDSEGLLVIGETKNLETRRKTLFRAIEKSAKHSEGTLWKYILNHSYFKKKHLNHKLQFRFYKMDGENAAKQAESRLIKAYICKYGEPPPLNSAIPDRHGNWKSEVSDSLIHFG